MDCFNRGFEGEARLFSPKSMWADRAEKSSSTEGCGRWAAQRPRIAEARLTDPSVRRADSICAREKRADSPRAHYRTLLARRNKWKSGEKRRMENGEWRMENGANAQQELRTAVAWPLLARQRHRAAQSLRHLPTPRAPARKTAGKGRAFLLSSIIGLARARSAAKMLSESTKRRRACVTQPLFRPVPLMTHLRDYSRIISALKLSFCSRALVIYSSTSRSRTP